jgi:hypothetical protein
MTFALTYPAHGRGAFPDSGLGGTFNESGNGRGPYYRTPTIATSQAGEAGAYAIQHQTSCSIDVYAVYMAVKGIQFLVGADADGYFGPLTGASVKAYQQRSGLEVDGVVGPQTCHSLFAPVVKVAAKLQNALHVDQLYGLAMGTLFAESMIDPGAVGYADPHDLGIGQISGPSHPALSVDDRLDPIKAIKWIVGFIDSNLKAMSYVQGDAIAAYNLGITGAMGWVKAGRPDFWGTANVKQYIALVEGHLA